MGKNKKEHRKRVAARKERMKGLHNTYQKLYQEAMKKQLEELIKEHKEKFSGETENEVSEDNGMESV
jgi:hypothetical protein